MATPAAAFDSRFAEMKGDILAVQGKKAEAKAAYKLALAKLRNQGRQPQSLPRRAAAEARQPRRSGVKQRLLLGLTAATLAWRMFDGFRMPDAINPFASSGPKIAELFPIKATAEVRQAWSVSVGKAGSYVLVPAVVGRRRVAGATG